ncbi:MAG: hypothetical protein AAFY03_03065 [Pseudomonadota bacterium]
MLDEMAPKMVPLLPHAQRILSEGDTPDRRASDTRFWVEEPMAILREFLDSKGEKRARVVANELGVMSNTSRLRAEHAIAFEGRRDLDAEAEEMLYAFWNIVGVKATRLSAIGGGASLTRAKIGTSSALYSLGWTKHARQAAVAIEAMIRFDATLDRRKVIPGPIRYDMHPIGWLEVLSIRHVLKQPITIKPEGDESEVRAYEDLAAGWDSPDQTRFDELFGLACDAYMEHCTVERDRTDGSRGVSKWLRPYGLEAFLRGRSDKGLELPGLDHPVFSPAPSRDVRQSVEVPDLPSEVTDALHLLDRLSDNILFDA